MEALDNLVTIKALNREPPNQVEFEWYGVGGHH